MTTWIGLDISKKTIDVSFQIDGKTQHFKIDNTTQGFKRLIKDTPADSKYAMEATGWYFLRCAKYLKEHSKYVSVVNPKMIKHAMTANLIRTKSDKADAKFIASWATLYTPNEWSMPTKIQVQCQSLQGIRDEIKKTITRRKNQREASLQLGSDMGDSVKFLNKTIRTEEKFLKEIEAKLEELVKSEFKEEVKLVRSIPGVGPQTTTAIIAKIGDGSRFKTAGELTSFFGLTPTSKQSGTSLNSRGRISKMGNSRIRAYLYMCAVNAIGKLLLLIIYQILAIFSQIIITESYLFNQKLYYF